MLKRCRYKDLTAVVTRTPENQNGVQSGQGQRMHGSGAGHQQKMRTTKLGDNDATIGSIVVDVGGRHPHAWQTGAVALLDMVRLHANRLLSGSLPSTIGFICRNPCWPQQCTKSKTSHIECQGLRVLHIERQLQE